MKNEQPAVSDLLSLKGRRVLVTGGSGNIGRGISHRLAEAGAEVVVHYHRDFNGAARTVDEIIAAGGIASSAQADLSSEAETQKLLVKAGADISGVVNNAAIQPVSDLRNLTSDEWRATMAANLDSAFHVTRGVASRMRQHALPGSVVNIASIEGSDPAAGHSHYSTSKAGLLMFTRACALEYGRDGIRVNAVSPGLIDREGLVDSWPDGVQRWLSHAPLARLGDTTDIADAVLFLLSDAARWVTGANLVVDGGMSAASRW